MRHQHVGDVVVDETDGASTPVGLETDRDLVIELVAPGVDPAVIKLDVLLIGRLATVDERETCVDTVRLMATKVVRRMPVVKPAGALVGIVTLDDLLPHRASELAELSQLAARSRERELEARK